MKDATLLCCFVLLVVLPNGLALDNGLARTPILGFNTWNYFACNINETVIKQTAHKLVELGLVEAGYTYLNIDDCWAYPIRDAQGHLQPDPHKFPSGMKALGDHLHHLGLKFGIYSDAGLFTCAGYPGSLGHEAADASLWSSWGVDYLKYDNCFAASEDVIARYQTMGAALNATGRPIVYSLCEWGVSEPWHWAPELGNCWRTDADISASWDGVLRCLDNGVVGLGRFAGPGGWNDPDMLEIGNGGLASTMQRSHFALWALAKAPLLIGTDLRRISRLSLNILKATEVIALNQDPLGVAGDLIWKQGPLEIYAAPLKGGGRGVVLFNRHLVGPPIPITVPWELLGYPSDAPVTVRELYRRQDLGEFKGKFTARVFNGDVAVVRLEPKEAREEYEAWRPWEAGPAPAPSGAAAPAAGAAVAGAAAAAGTGVMAANVPASAASGAAAAEVRGTAASAAAAGGAAAPGMDPAESTSARTTTATSSSSSSFVQQLMSHLIRPLVSSTRGCLLQKLLPWQTPSAGCRAGQREGQEQQQQQWVGVRDWKARSAGFSPGQGASQEQQPEQQQQWVGAGDWMASTAGSGSGQADGLQEHHQQQQQQWVGAGGWMAGAAVAAELRAQQASRFAAPRSHVKGQRLRRQQGQQSQAVV